METASFGMSTRFQIQDQQRKPNSTRNSINPNQKTQEVTLTCLFCEDKGTKRSLGSSIENLGPTKGLHQMQIAQKK
jgi:hypothetical protein